MRLLFLLYGCCFAGLLYSQKKDTTRYHLQTDSVLQEVTVTAFHSHQQWIAVPAAVAVVTSEEMGRYANTSLVPAFNTVPGVRMEERSPESYRLSVRGSLLRSPFGVREVKVYWNDMPLTDGGGNTYLNLVDMSQITEAEIIKGPAASVYGAGTGGALLLRSGLYFSALAQNHFTAGTTGGSYGLFQEEAGWQYTEKKFAASLQQSHQQSDGYRQQSASRKDVVKWQTAWQTRHQQFSALVFYTDLFYQTPGGITLAQMQLNPKLSRQPGGGFPGAIQQQAAIYNKTIFGGLHHELAINDHFVLKTFVSGNHTSFTNPFITNYEERGEANFGAGTNLVYQLKTSHTRFEWMTGAEGLFNHSVISDFGNLGGRADTVQAKQDIYATQWFAFSQMQYTVNDQWIFTAGLSLNNQYYRYERLTDPNPAYLHKNISLIATPRLSVLYRVSRWVSLYALAAKGFSPPSLAEVSPSGGSFNSSLMAESGWNYESGIKGELFNGRLHLDIAMYYFTLYHAIVSQTNAAGVQYFVNAGATRQNGLEGLIRYQLVKQQQHFFSGITVWSSYSYQPYRFIDYQENGMNYSGNHLTGVPENIWVSGIDMATRKGIYMNLSVNCTSSLPLTDANDAFAGAYQLVQVKWGYRHAQAKNRIHLFCGIDNLLNQVYSLGNDINAAGKRYYNPAAGRSFFAGMDYHF